MKIGFTDVAYTIKKGSQRTKELIKYYKENNLIDLRFGMNLVTVPSRNELGDFNQLIETFQYIRDQGFRIHLYLFLSDDVANAGQGDCPKAWEKDSYETVAEKLKNDCVQCVRMLRENGIKIDSYTVGNETEWGICGYRLGDRIDSTEMKTDEDFEWLRENLWKPVGGILKGCCDAIKQEDPDTEIVIHSDSVGKESFTYEYLKCIFECGVNCDAIGLTYNPWTLWDEDYNQFSKIKRTINKVSVFQKPLWFVEYCYPNQLVTNGELTEVPPQSKYPYTREGQTSFHLDFMDLCDEMQIETLFLWRAEHEKEDDISHEVGMFENGKMDKQIMDRLQRLRG